MLEASSAFAICCNQCLAHPIVVMQAGCHGAPVDQSHIPVHKRHLYLVFFFFFIRALFFSVNNVSITGAVASVMSCLFLMVIANEMCGMIVMGVSCTHSDLLCIDGFSFLRGHERCSFTAAVASMLSSYQLD